MITFTVPEEIRGFFRSRQGVAYAALFKASSEAMKTLVADERFIGGDVPGFFGVLHTWGRTLNYHPHIHYVVAGGAWSRSDNSWHPSRPGFYVPNKALSRIYRAKFRDLMRDAGMSRLIDPAVFRDGWNVNIQPVGAAEQSIRYLSHYVFKVAISDHRIVDVADGTVTFSYKKPKSRRTRYMKLDAEDFMSRFLQHSLPPGFMKVRYYGFMHPCSGVPLEKVRTSIDLLAGDLLRRHVAGRSQNDARLGPGSALDAGDAEIGDPDFTDLQDHDVGRFNVPVDNWGFLMVEVFECVSNLFCPVQYF